MSTVFFIVAPGSPKNSQLLAREAINGIKELEIGKYLSEIVSAHSR
jgi:hypothetical protein